ncbi:MAG: NAD(P)/FAD-dependent oxidoreductase [Anaerolineae bacterium]|nr:NAD(P)/FAD-dependent oxidoreductase [Anaerolineae bacterium]
MVDLGGDVLVIGAGPSGLASAYYLEQAGISYVIVDRADEVASTWAHLYRSLHLNTASFVTYLPGKRMPVTSPVYPAGHKLYEYIRQYAEEHDFNIRLGVSVRRVAPENGGWLAETSEGSFWFPCVIVATGRYCAPIIPALPGMNDFRGQILHARDYRLPSTFAGQRILVVGAGPSGVDIALELTQAAQLPVYLSVRSDIVISRSFPYGLPNSAWLILARGLLPKRWHSKFLNKVLYHGYPDSRAAAVEIAPNRTDRKGTSTPIRGRGLIDAVRASTIKPVPGVTGFHQDAVELADGSRLPVDTVILCTGYRPVLDYLDIPFETDSQGYPKRADDLDEGGTTEVLGWPGLYLVGRFYRGLGPLHNIRGEAKRAVQEIRARLQIP